MKMTTMMMTVVCGLAMQAMAAAPANNSPVAAELSKNTTQRINHFQSPKAPASYKLERVGGISSRPWARTASWSPGPSQFVGDRERFHDVQFSLFSLGSKSD